MAKRRNERLKYTGNRCPLCGRSKGILVSNKPRFKANVAYNDGPCDGCKPRWEQTIKELASGAILLICKSCTSIGTTMGVTPEFAPFVIQMPDGTRRLELPYCPNCKEAKDAEDASQNESTQDSA